MYPAKIPYITQHIERRIRRNVYTDRIPPTRELAAEFNVARQTMTDALKNLVQSGLLKNFHRKGLLVDRSALKSGSIVVVSRRPDGLIAKLQNVVLLDGLKFVEISAKTPRELERVLPEDTMGILFTDSSLTVETADYLQKKQIPFVSCNQLPGFRQINWVDWDIYCSLKELFTPIAALGYRRVGCIFSGHMENFNEQQRRELLKVKRQLNLPHEPYDNAVVYWQGSLDQILKKTVDFFREKNSYPEALVCFAHLSDEQIKFIRELPEPPALLLKESSENNVSVEDGIYNFYSAIPHSEKELQGYELLRCAIFMPSMYPVQILLQQKYIFPTPLTKQEKKS